VDVLVVVVGCQEELYIGSGWMDGLVVATSRRGNLAVFCRSEELAMREHAKFFATRDYYDRGLLSSNGKGISKTGKKLRRRLRIYKRARRQLVEVGRVGWLACRVAPFWLCGKQWDLVPD
jgi:hypothetical protein